MRITERDDGLYQERAWCNCPGCKRLDAQNAEANVTIFYPLTDKDVGWLWSKCDRGLDPNESAQLIRRLVEEVVRLECISENTYEEPTLVAVLKRFEIDPVTWKVD